MTMGCPRQPGGPAPRCCLPECPPRPRLQVVWGHSSGEPFAVHSLRSAADADLVRDVLDSKLCGPCWLAPVWGPVCTLPPTTTKPLR